jgi:tetratricopeptide (TPR) repeat protein
VRALRGEWNAAIEDFGEARRIADRAGDLFRVYVTKVWEGGVCTQAGNPGRGRILLEEALALRDHLGTRMHLAHAQANLAAALVALGEPDAVLGLCEEAARLAEEMADKVYRALAHRVLAEATSRLEPPDLSRAERAMLEAVRIQQEIGTRPELARSYASYARLLKSGEDRGKAREYLVKAIGLFHEMGMAWDLERAEQALREF